MDELTRAAAVNHMGTLCELEWQRAGGRALTPPERAELRADIKLFFDCLTMGDNPPPVKACPDCGSLDPSPCSAGRCVRCCNRLCNDSDCRARGRA